MKILKLTKVCRDKDFTNSPVYVPAHCVSFFEELPKGTFFSMQCSDSSVQSPYAITCLHMSFGGGYVYVRQTCEELEAMMEEALR